MLRQAQHDIKHFLKKFLTRQLRGFESGWIYKNYEKKPQRKIRRILPKTTAHWTSDTHIPSTIQSPNTA
jgi:hypothetical protein